MILRLSLVWLFNLIDTAATLHLYLVYDGTELNPISARLLQCPLLFVTFKLLTMTIAVVFLWWKRDWFVSKLFSWVLFVEYLLVAIYYVLLCAFVV